MINPDIELLNTHMKNIKYQLDEKGLHESMKKYFKGELLKCEERLIQLKETHRKNYEIKCKDKT